MNLPSIIVLAVVIFITVLAVRAMVRDKKSRKGCGGCKGCSSPGAVESCPAYASLEKYLKKKESAESGGPESGKP